MILSQNIEDELRSLEGGWVVTPCLCSKCGHTWMSVWPIDLDIFDISIEEEVDRALDEGIPQLECSKCGQRGYTEENYDF